VEHPRRAVEAADELRSLPAQGLPAVEAGLVQNPPDLLERESELPADQDPLEPQQVVVDRCSYPGS
jgi:hypothetical protein